AVAAHERHRRVRVAVHQPGEERHSRGVDHVVGCLGLHVRPDSGDALLLHPQPDPLAVEQRVPHREAHDDDASLARTGTTAPSAPTSRARLEAAPEWNSANVSGLSPTPLARLSTTHTAAYAMRNSPARMHSLAIVMPMTSA